MGTEVVVVVGVEVGLSVGLSVCDQPPQSSPKFRFLKSERVEEHCSCAILL